MASSKPSSPGTTHNISEGNLRDAEAAMTFLEKENFDLKMRVYYLEESMTGGMSGASEMDGSGRNRSRSNGRDHVSSVDGDANLKISELHLELEEKKAELEQRNMLLTKSKEMMEKMKSEMVDIRKDADPRGREEMQERIVKLKQANEDMEKTRHEQVNELEATVAETKQLVFHKDQEIATLMTKVEQLQLDVAHKEDRLTEARDQHDRDQQHILLVNTKCEKMDEELVQARAHVELYRLETEDHRKEAEKLMLQLREAEDMTHHQQELHDLRKNLEAAHATHTERVHGDHKIAMQELRDEIDKLHEQHKVDIHNLTERQEVQKHDLTQRHELECNRIREETSNQKEELRLEREREREDMNTRLEERTDEARKLHTQVDHYRSKVDHLIKEIEAAKIAEEAAKVELSFKGNQFDDMKSELANANDELRQNKRAHEQAAIMKEELRRETNEKESLIMRWESEKAELQHKLDHTSEMYEQVKLNMHDNEYKRNVAEAELKSIKATHATVEQISRDNEKYQHENAELEKNLQGEKFRGEGLQRDIEDRDRQIGELKHRVDLLTSDLSHAEANIANVTATRDELNLILTSDRQKLGSLDSVVSDLKTSAEAQVADFKAREAALLKENDTARQQILEVEKARLSTDTKYSTVKREYSTSCVAATEAMAQWDMALTELLDGLTTFAPDGSMAGGTAIHFMGSQSGMGTPYGGAAALHSTHERLSMSHLGGVALSSGLSAEANNSEDELHTTLLPTMDKLCERIRMKIERFGRIRTLFVSGYEKEVKKVVTQFENVTQKNAILAAKVARCENDAERIRSTIRRDEEIRLSRERDFERFRQDTMSSHADALRAAEQRYHNQAIQLTQAQDALQSETSRRVAEVTAWEEKHSSTLRAKDEEMAALTQSHASAVLAMEEEASAAKADWAAKSEDMLREIEMHREQERDLEESVRLLREQVEGLHRDLEQYAEAEHVVSELSARCEEVGRERDALHSQLQEEIARKEGVIHEAARVEEELRSELDRAGLDSARVHEEKMAMLAEYSKEIEGQQASLTALETAKEAKDDRIDSLLGEVDRLKARQITPELAQMIKDTQAIMSATEQDNQEVVAETQGLRDLVTDLHAFVSDSARPAAAGTAGSVSMHAPPKHAFESATPIASGDASAGLMSLAPTSSAMMSPLGKSVSFGGAAYRAKAPSEPLSAGADSSMPAPVPAPRRVVPSVASTSKFRETVGGPARASSFGGTGLGTAGGPVGASMGNQLMSSYSNSGSRVVVQNSSTLSHSRSPGPGSVPRAATLGNNTATFGAGAMGGNSSYMQGMQGQTEAPQWSALNMQPAAPAVGTPLGTPLGTMLQQQQQQQSVVSSSAFGQSSGATYAPGDRRGLAPTPDGLGVRFSSGMSRPATAGSPLSTSMRGLNNSILRGTPGKEPTTPGTATRQSVSRLQRLGGDIKALASKLDAMSNR
jgi:chromosome segregation ATPase